jgi:aminopeptidase-like protein
LKATVSAAATGSGTTLYRFAERLYPICRSITGQGVRETLAIIGGRIPLKIHEVRTGTRVFDWQIPPEWNVEDAAVLDPDGRRVVDFRAHNLHLMGYSEPVHTSMPLEELAPRLHVLPERPDWIPYRTSYYTRSWGFCMAARERERLRPGRYRIEIKTSLAPGSLSYGESLLRGRSKEEVLFFTHTCHPSLANDNVSGMAITTALAEWVAAAPRYFTYRFVFAPGTIGSLTWLKRNEAGLKRVRHALVLGLLGDSAPLTYKRSRRDDSEIDQIAGYVLGTEGRQIAFSPYGYDERQLCSPGFDLPAGRLTRSVNGGYAEYHSSADDLSLITPTALAASLAACQRMVEVMEGNRRYTNLKPKGEPRLGSRGLYGSVGGRTPTDSEHALLWVLNQSDGKHSLLDIARRSGMPFAALRDAAHALETKKLLRCEQPGLPAAAAGRPRRTPKSGRNKS